MRQSFLEESSGKASYREQSARISCNMDFLLPELSVGIATVCNFYCKDLALGFATARISR